MDTENLSPEQKSEMLTRLAVSDLTMQYRAIIHQFLETKFTVTRMTEYLESMEKRFPDKVSSEEILEIALKDALEGIPDGDRAFVQELLGGLGEAVRRLNS